MVTARSDALPKAEVLLRSRCAIRLRGSWAPLRDIHQSGYLRRLRPVSATRFRVATHLRCYLTDRPASRGQRGRLHTGVTVAPLAAAAPRRPRIAGADRLARGPLLPNFGGTEFRRRASLRAFPAFAETRVRGAAVTTTGRIVAPERPGCGELQDQLSGLGSAPLCCVTRSALPLVLRAEDSPRLHRNMPGHG